MTQSNDLPQRGGVSKPPENAVFVKVIADVAQQCNVQSSQIEDLYPCTALQHGLFVLSATSGGAYIAQHVFKIQDSTDVDRLKEAWNRVILRNAIFRTRIVARENRALQVVVKDWIPKWRSFTDLSVYLATDKNQTMDYGEPLLRLAISETHLVWTAHHSIYDGFSVEIMLEDISTVYGGGTLPVRQPFRNFVKYAQLANDNPTFKSFWASLLTGRDVLPFPALPTGYRSRPNDTMEHDILSLASTPSGITAATLVQAAWTLVLSSQLCSSSVSYGTTLNGRNADMAGIDKVMGPTLSTVPISFHVDYEKSVPRFLREMQQYFTQLIPHVHVGLQTLKDISPEAAKACEFQNLLAVHSVGQENTTSPYDHLLVHEHQPNSTDYLSYPLTIQLFVAASGKMKAVASFDNAVIDAPRMRRLLHQLEHVIRQLGLATDEKPLREINLVSPEDLKQIELWNQKPEIPAGFPLDEINNQVSSRANSTAICAWDGELSYSELDKLSSRLAQYLISKHGVGPEVIVPICFERSLWMTVAVLATMKTGAAFTLMDPVYPLKRLENIIKLTSSKVILVSKACQSLFDQSRITCIALNDAAFAPGGLITPTTTLYSRFRSPCSQWLSLDNAMYVVFTSGSTGEPKGVVITFGSYYAGAMAHIPYYELGPQTRNLSFVSPAFDLCIQEMVSTLMAGGCLCVPSDSDRFGDIINVIESMKVNLASFTPSFARQINADDIPSLKRLALVGEAVPKDQRDAWADKLWLHNSYGPAECSVISTINRRVTKSSNPANIGSVIIGSGWIVDPDNHDRLVPIGSTGELLIEGPLLGRGYLNAPEKTAAVFVKNALRTLGSDNSARRFYKTGDLVRYDVDGTLIFEGRKDTQIKIRGQRVEITEVEYHLRQLFSKAAGVAVELSKHDDVAELIAFVFCDGLWDEDKIQPENLPMLLSHADIKNMTDTRSHLRQVLPHHMVPTHCYLAPKLPVLPSGKLDRKHLRHEILNPSGSYFKLKESETRVSAIGPENTIALQISEKIVGMLEMRGVNGAADIYGKDVNITELGLDSIQFIAILTFLRKEYEVKLSVAVLYDENLTILGLAKIVSECQAGTLVEGEETAVDLLKEIRVSYEDFSKRSDAPNKRAKTVLLTGATGYLGSQILRQLLDSSSVKKVIAHVRASNATKALDRIISVASIGKWWSESYMSRIECWVGDLAAPKLGLSSAQWNILSGDCHANDHIDCIIHNGATVQWQAPYSALKAANIGSTLELLTALRQSPTPRNFTYVSGGAERAADMDLESFAKDLKTASGYSQTKFVAEQITAKFADSSSQHNVSIVRPGFIIGTEKEGVPNTDDFLWRLVQACVSISSYPADNQDFWLSIADVEEVADSVVASNLAQELNQHSSKIKPVATGLVIKDFWEIVNEELKQSLKPVPGEEWVQRIKNLLANAEDTHEFQPFMAMLQDDTFSLGLPARTQARSDSRVFAAFRKNIQTLLGTGYLWIEQSGKEGQSIKGAAPERAVTFSRSGFMGAKLGQVVS